MTTDVDSVGRLRLKRGAAKSTKPPADAEALRVKYKLIAHAWVFARTKHSSRAWLVDFNPRLFDTLADHILGPTVMGLEGKNSQGQKVPMVNWQQVLTYEEEVRRAAYEFVNDGVCPTLTLAVKKAMTHPETRELHLIDCLVLDRESSAPPPSSSSQYGPLVLREGPGARSIPYAGGRGDKGKGQRKGWGKNKGKMDRNKIAKIIDSFTRRGLVVCSKTPAPDNRPICFVYNNGGACDGTCGYAHVCQVCFAAHAMVHHDASGGKGAKALPAIAQG